MKKHTLLGMAVACALNSFNAAAFVESELTIWMPMDKGQKGMTYAVEKFEEDTGIKVNVEFPVSLEERFVQVASVGKGPDIMVFAHDRFGGYAESGLVREVKPAQDFQNKFEAFSWDAVSYKGKLYGYPIAAESVSLIYNKDLVKEPLKNWEDVFGLDKKLSAQGKKAIAWDVKTPYFTHPLYSSAGAYVFEHNAKGFNPDKTGVNTPEAKRTMAFLKRMIDDKLVSPDMDYAYAESAFNKGEVAMTVNGPWAWANLDKTGVNYGVAELPKFEGKPSRPFVGILMAGINNASPNGDIAQEFIENYLLSIESLRYMNSQVPIGVPALKAFSKELEDDSRVHASLVNARNGDVMPNIPQMMSYWHGLGAAITNVIEGRQTVDESLTDLEKRILEKQ
ncbi:maltose/maltodextrin ABC transporter substrate-binding protein MalE [Photobacterium sp. OFAV2-7]|uniref:maltose/maltodextrin ABC transporter substrate-binding protein MalE n=1 Tax=Photobacterium sp. OFAV2-7 TaxID=2917748 RepID=UPI001EF42E05|nr:maltose/maltodextrin ABC transporter substrate-binding protein MalE [Photobacterium sp. OFAV2-7]MCG7586576.1 maltose/maltodextrin ABC transporter substrate-binding protein MalE [Photobacterium sp. OFAV2-7]